MQRAQIAAFRVALVVGIFAVLPSVAAAAPAPVAAFVPRVPFRDLGEIAPGTPISLAVTLNYHHPEHLEQLIELQSDPGSPYYRHWLTSDQFEATFAPSTAEYLHAIAALRNAGFRITQTFPNRTVIDARGTTAAAERYFQTPIHRVYQPGYGVRFSNIRPATVPAGLQGLVFAVDGLNNLAIVHTDYRGVTRRGHTVVEKSSSLPYLGPISTLTNSSGYAPLVFSQDYDFPTRHSTKTAAYDGTGRASAIVIDADFLDSDLASYLAYFHIKRTGKTLRVPVDGGTTSDPGLSNADSVETTLDVETFAGMAPGVNLYVYETAPFAWSTDVVADAYNLIVSQNKVDTVNSSFGLCETADQAITQVMDHIAAQGAALGITFHAASGDYGSACNAYGAIGVDAPASSPHVVAVGGTSLSANPNDNYRYGSETGWGDAYGASGGGTSMMFPVPSWQKGEKNVSTAGRDVPDVSFNADPATGTAFYYAATWNNPWNPIGGTSLASPLFGAALAEIDEIVGGRTGLAGQRLFDVWKKDHYTLNGTLYFHDITSGNNGGYQCLVGYDNVTGIGSLDVWNIAQALKK